MNVTPENNCQLEDVAAYLDGELNSCAQTDFESHVIVCSSCASELRTQRQLLCTLDAAFAASLDCQLSPRSSHGIGVEPFCPQWLRFNSSGQPISLYLPPALFSKRAQ